MTGGQASSVTKGTSKEPHPSNERRQERKEGEEEAPSAASLARRDEGTDDESLRRT